MTIAIDHDRQALLAILATLVAMVGLGPHPEMLAEGEPRRALSRRLRNMVLRLLRPAEAATRRLVIALARGLVVTLAAPRPPLSFPAGGFPSPSGGGRTGGVVSTGRALHATGIVWPAGMAPPVEIRPLRPLALPLLDPLRPPFARRRACVPPHLAPRISTPGYDNRRPLVAPPSPDDLLDSRRVGQRLAALGAALDDLPKQALRFARWQACQDRLRAANAAKVATGRIRPGQRVRWPLRRGRVPNPRGRRRHEVHDILAHAHELAVWALDNPDTS